MFPERRLQPLGITIEPRTHDPAPAKDAGREQINARAALKPRASARLPPGPAGLCKEAHRTTAFPDQTGTVATDPDLALAADERVKRTDGVMSVRSTRPDVLKVEHAKILPWRDRIGKLAASDGGGRESHRGGRAHRLDASKKGIVRVPR